MGSLSGSLKFNLSREGQEYSINITLGSADDKTIDRLDVLIIHTQTKVGGLFSEPIETLTGPFERFIETLIPEIIKHTLQGTKANDGVREYNDKIPGHPLGRTV